MPRLEPGYNPGGQWVQPLKLFALASGEGVLPAWFEALKGGHSDSTTYVPQFEAFCQHAKRATWLPLDQVLVMGDGKMPSQDNQLAWLRLGVGYIGPLTMQAHHQQSLRDLLGGGTWLAALGLRGAAGGRPEAERTVYQGLSQEVELRDPQSGQVHRVRHLYVRSSARAEREARRRQEEIAVIEAELRRIQGLVNKYDYTCAEVILRRVQQKAFKKGRAQRYFQVQVIEPVAGEKGPLALVYTFDREACARDAELEGVYLLVAGGPGAQLEDSVVLREWKGQYKVEHCFRLTNQQFVLGPLFLKNPRRLAALVLLIMVGCLVAGLIQRQVQRVLAQRQAPLQGLMPEGRDPLRPSVARLFKAFAGYGVVLVKDAAGQLLQRRLARPTPVQQQILELLALPWLPGAGKGHLPPGGGPAPLAIT